MSIKRILDFSLPQGQSVFLWGPRKTGKSTFLKENFPDSIVYDFLKTEVYFKYLSEPSLLRQELELKKTDELKVPVILDEVQKIPQILDEVHWLIENRKTGFILCGSSARKLKRGHANMLGGRAWRFELFPFVSAELKEFDLLRALNNGLIPSHYLEEKYSRRLINAYVQDYLKEEIFDEGLTRNVPAFSRFFDSLAYSHGELTNYSNIARDCGVSAKTVKEYYQILVDTNLGTMVEPYIKNQSRQVISRAPKFYLFDVGVAGAIVKRYIEEQRGAEFGKAFEHFIFMELKAYSYYSEKNYDIHFWRTKSGLEVDFILNRGSVAVEVKGSCNVRDTELKGMLSFKEDNNPQKTIVVSNETTPRLCKGIMILPWKTFLKQLWNGEII